MRRERANGKKRDDGNTLIKAGFGLWRYRGWLDGLTMNGDGAGFAEAEVPVFDGSGVMWGLTGLVRRSVRPSTGLRMILRRVQDERRGLGECFWWVRLGPSTGFWTIIWRGQDDHLRGFWRFFDGV